MAKDAIHPAGWKRHDRPTTPGVLAASLVCFSGQVGTDHAAGTLAGDSAYDQTVQALRNVEAILRAAGGDLGDLVKVTVFVAGREVIGEMNRAYAELVPAPFPARSCVQAGLARDELLVEIEGLAVLSS